MRILPILFLTLLMITGCHRVKPTEGPLQIDTPSGWEAKYRPSQGNEFYNLGNEKTGAYVVFVFAPGIPSSKISAVLNGYAKTFPTEAAEQGTKLESETPVMGEIVGPSFNGKYQMFSLQNGTKSVYFLISDGRGTWQGKYNGTEEGWKSALEIIKGIKKK